MDNNYDNQDYRNENIAKYLIKKGADISTKSYDGSISLHCACGAKKENVNLVKYLIADIGLNIRVKDNYGKTSLHYVYINIQDKYGKAPLHYACYKENRNIIKYLIEKGANKNLIDDNRFTPLFYIQKKIKECI
ncbi:ankyrin [Piromyces finnis]|uniref:Ankyrin n=1 Tax=Piromyces finnis TaxID=1754191 RepID=A0A1Y1UZ78_9FUNG|nr:ankyrin [Piromyces finnis]|eukprot:ORX42664.1 ankyrin [Piromyces finnis]